MSIGGGFVRYVIARSGEGLLAAGLAHGAEEAVGMDLGGRRRKGIRSFDHSRLSPDVCQSIEQLRPFLTKTKNESAILHSSKKLRNTKCTLVFLETTQLFFFLVLG